MTEMGTCELCAEALTLRDDVVPMNPFQVAHRECLLRCVLGGIGHLENHELWCNQRHDPDGGRTYRQSALEVWAATHDHEP
jgi:hypothetical protein